jgi:hypothetical protein
MQLNLIIELHFGIKYLFISFIMMNDDEMIKCLIRIVSSHIITHRIDTIKNMQKKAFVIIYFCIICILNALQKQCCIIFISNI